MSMRQMVLSVCSSVAAKPAAGPVSDQVSMLDMQSDELRRALEAVTVETLTPIEAMNVLYQLKQLL